MQRNHTSPHLKLLIAEDDPALSALLVEYLQEKNYDIQVCCRGDDAIEALKKEQFDIVLADIVMPGAHGTDILEQVKNDPTRTLVLLMTGYSGIHDAIQSIEQGAYDFISKPFLLPEVGIRVDNAARYQALLRKSSHSQDYNTSHNQRLAIQAYQLDKKR